MSDIDLYTTQPEKYDLFQHSRPDYTQAINVSASLADKYMLGKDITLLDLCSGTGVNSLNLSTLHLLEKVVLVDINENFLQIAKYSGIISKSLQTIPIDVRLFEPQNKFNLVFSIFAYHHIPDNDKDKYVRIIERALIPGGLLILTEIFFNNKIQEKAYYNKLYNSISEDDKSPGLKQFLDQTANSTDSEFKVSKSYADNQLRKLGFSLLEEIKIWPKDNDDNGTFVQVYQHGTLITPRFAKRKQ